jgi:hypothetical protein
VKSTSKYIRGWVDRYNYESAGSTLRCIGFELECRGLDTEARILGLMGDEIEKRIAADYYGQSHHDPIYEGLMSFVLGIMDRDGIYTADRDGPLHKEEWVPDGVTKEEKT